MMPPVLYYLSTKGLSLIYRGVEQLEARRAHNPEVVGSSPASATITDTVNDTIVSFTVSFFIPTFTLK